MSGVCQHVNVGRSQEREDERGEGREERSEGEERGGEEDRRKNQTSSSKVPSALFLKHLCAAYPILTSSLKDKRLTFSLVSLVHKMTYTTVSRIEP